MAEIVGYDFQPTTKPSIFIRLRKKGDQVKIRLVSTPVHYQDQFQGKTRDRFAWLVIDRSDGQVKVFSGGTSIYLIIKGFAQDPDWGDPTKYDLTITRTEESNANYYRVVPSPVKSEITEEELKLIKESNIDLIKLFGNKGTSTFGKVRQGAELKNSPLRTVSKPENVSKDIPKDIKDISEDILDEVTY
jgi:hypothetical protein